MSAPREGSSRGERRRARRERAHGKPAAPAAAREADRRPSRAKTPREPVPRALWAILAVALVLRLWNIRHGLPDFLDEAIPLRGAHQMSNWVSGAIDWNPHRFHYPSLSYYLHLLVQRTVFAAGAVFGAFASFPDYVLRAWADPSLLALPGRGMSVAFDVWTVWSVGRIGERMQKGAGLLAAALLACSATMILSARLVYTDTLVAAFGTAAIERMLAWLARGGDRRLAAAVVMVGLATGSKYPAALLLLPLLAVIALREPRRAVPLALASGAGALAVFLVTSPFILLDFSQFVKDFSFVGRLGSAGQLGNYERAGFLYHMKNVVRDLGWAAPALLAVSLPLAVLRFRERREPAVLWAGLLALGLPIALARIEADRYLIPVLPFVVLLVAWAALALAARVPERLRLAASLAVAAMLVVPALLEGVRAGGSLEDATRIEARRWCEKNLKDSDLIVQETYGAPLMERLRLYSVHSGAVYAAASAGARRAYDARPAFRCVTLPITVVGMNWMPVTPAAGGAPVSVEIAPRPGDLNAPLYDPRLYLGVDVFVTSSSIRGRFEADSARFAAPLRFYALLDSAAERLATFSPHGGSTGPEVRIYRLTDRTRAAIRARGGLPALWWLDVVEPSYRPKTEALLLPPERRGAEPAIGADGNPATWVRSLKALFSTRYMELVLPLATDLFERRKYAEALELANPILLMVPEQVGASVIVARASNHFGEWARARDAVERTERTLPPGQPPPGALALEHAEALARLGDRVRAREELEALKTLGDPGLAREADAKLAALGLAGGR